MTKRTCAEDDKMRFLHKSADPTIQEMDRQETNGARHNPGKIRASLIRPLVQKLHAYVPGEQPRVKGLIKLNTNENPYPPSPKVLAAVKNAVDGRLGLYPNPTAQALRER